MQYKVPQDVQQADRIVWFLTLPQLIICVVGFAIAYAIYSVLNKQGLPLIIWLPPVGIVALLTAAFAFLKIANLPFYKYLALIVERLMTPSKRVWVKGADRVITDEKFISLKDKNKSNKKKKEEENQASKLERIQNIGELTEELDNLKKEAPEEEKVQEINETADEKLIQTAFLDEKNPKKKEEKKEITAEDKILELSKKPREKELEEREELRELEEKKDSKDAIDRVTELNQEEKPKRKRRRRRRRKKKKVNTEELGENTEGTESKGNKGDREGMGNKEGKEGKGIEENMGAKKEAPIERKENSPLPKQDPPLPEWMTSEKETKTEVPSDKVQEPNKKEEITNNLQTEKTEAAPLPEEKAQKIEVPNVKDQEKQVPTINENTAPQAKQDPPLPEWMTTEEEKNTKNTATESGDSIPRHTDLTNPIKTNTKAKNEDSIPQEKQKASLPASTSGEFTPDQLEGEGQVIQFDSSESNNDQKTNPNDQ